MTDKEKTILLFVLFAVVGFFIAWQWRQGAMIGAPVRTDDSTVGPEDIIPPVPTNVADYTSYNIIWRSAPPVATSFPNGGARFANAAAPGTDGSCRTCSAINNFIR